MTKKLTAKQKKFIDKYLQSGNGTQAAIKAGYAEKGARVTANRLLTNANISAIIQKRQSKAASKADLSLEWIIQNIKSLAVTAKYDGDKLRALDMLMKHVGGYKENNKFALDIENLGDKQIIAIANILIEKL